jgi:hypothetical protein
MAKTRRIVIETDEQYAAYALTKLLAVIQPEIDEEATYEILQQCLENGLTHENAEQFGMLIIEASRETQAPRDGKLH